jgi:hypothetical protein
VEVKIISSVNHGEFLQTFATVTLDDKTTKNVSYCHKTLGFREDEVFNALMCAALAPPYVEPKPDPDAPKPEPIDPKDIKPYVPDTARVAKVTALKAAYDKLTTAQKVVTTDAKEVVK